MNIFRFIFEKIKLALRPNSTNSVKLPENQNKKHDEYSETINGVVFVTKENAKRLMTDKTITPSKELQEAVNDTMLKQLIGEQEFEALDSAPLTKKDISDIKDKWRENNLPSESFFRIDDTYEFNERREERNKVKLATIEEMKSQIASNQKTRSDAIKKKKKAQNALKKRKNK